MAVNRQQNFGERKITYCRLLFLMLLVQVLSAVPAAALQHSQEYDLRSGQVIIPWYGEEQYFGWPGLAQNQINIPGRVNTEMPATLTYSLNGGPEQPLNLGPDSRRLSRSGDFNIDIDADRLRKGVNTLRLTARKDEKVIGLRDIIVRYRQEQWPMPYRVDWQSAGNIQKAVQVVDGLWQVTDRGLRTAPGETGYDRSFAIGGMDWSGYEVVFPFTVHGIDDDAFSIPESAGPGFGVITHWAGHTDTPVQCGQPRCGWLPVGARNWYFFKRDGSGLNIITQPLPVRSVALPYDIQQGVTYFLRVRVEHKPFRNLYFMKIWREGENEPEAWSLSRVADMKNPDTGSLLIVAHHVDMTIGNIEVLPVSEKDSVPGDTAGNVFFGLREYIAPVPLILAVIAAMFVFRGAVRYERVIFRKIALAAGLSAAGLLCIVLVEPFFPAILRGFPLNAKLAAVLYLGLDLGRIFLQCIVWLMAVLFLLQKKRQGIPL